MSGDMSSVSSSAIQFDEVTGKYYTADKEMGETFWLQEKADVIKFVPMNTMQRLETLNELTSGVVEVVIEKDDEE
jgi:hypothetical protein